MAMEPGIQVDAALEAVEAVIGEDDEQCAIIGVRQRLSHGGISATVRFRDHLIIFEMRFSTGISRMIGFSEAPEHVLNAVGSIVKAIEKAIAKTIKLGAHHFFALLPEAIAL